MGSRRRVPALTVAVATTFVAADLARGEMRSLLRRFEVNIAALMMISDSSWVTVVYVSSGIFSVYRRGCTVIILLVIIPFLITKQIGTLGD